MPYEVRIQVLDLKDEETNVETVPVEPKLDLLFLEPLLWIPLLYFEADEGQNDVEARMEGLATTSLRRPRSGAARLGP